MVWVINLCPVKVNGYTPLHCRPPERTSDDIRAIYSEIQHLTAFAQLPNPVSYADYP